MNIPLEPDEFWLLARIGEREDQAEKADLAKRLAGDPHHSRIFERLASAGMARKTSAGSMELTEQGSAAYDRLVRQREEDLKKMLADWDRNEHPDVRAMMRELAKSFASSPPVKV